MENGIKKILRDKYGLFEKDIEILLEKFTKFSVPKREIILQEGQTDHYIYFVEKGIVKSTILRVVSYTHLSAERVKRLCASSNIFKFLRSISERRRVCSKLTEIKMNAKTNNIPNK